MNATLIKRQYGDLAGVDYKNAENLINLNRSPDALNVYKDYMSEGVCIQTRPGIRLIGKIGDKINGIYVYKKTQALVHSENTLYLWKNFPDSPKIEILKNDMNDSRTSFFKLNDKLYINDGNSYLVYDGTLKNMSDIAFVPITTIGRKPSGGGEEYQDVNVLTGYRKNQFCADGTSKDYYLDTEDIDKVETVWINDVETKDYIVDLILGKITFTTAPSRPDLDGQDNVVVLFKKDIQEYKSRISNCKISLAFDNRAFFSGNIDFPNAVFHSELNNPAYISDLNYYQDGSDNNQIKDMTVGNNILWVFKESNQNGSTIFYHIPTTDSKLGRIYPSKQGNIHTGCYSKSINFNDDIVFLSRDGLEGITGDIQSEQLLTHRSSLVDNKLINTNNYYNAQMAKWRGYLLILVDNYIFLADARQKFNGINGIEYEWYYWNISKAKPNIIKEYDNELYIGGNDGYIYVLGGTNDNGDIIESYWCTPLDAFGHSNKLKTTNKRGGVAKIKIIPNGIIKMSEKTSKKQFKYITKKILNGFEYENFDYSNFAYMSKNDSYIVFKIKEKKFNELSMKFYSDELDKPFGLYSITIEAFVGGYIKR